MKKTKVDLKDIAFTEEILPNGNLQISAEIRLRATSELSVEVARADAVRIEAKKKLIHMLLTAAYGDVWDLADWAQILIKREAVTHFYTPSSVFQILEILGRIGKTDDDIEKVLEPYRDPRK